MDAQIPTHCMVRRGIKMLEEVMKELTRSKIVTTHYLNVGNQGSTMESLDHLGTSVASLLDDAKVHLEECIQGANAQQRKSKMEVGSLTSRVWCLEARNADLESRVRALKKELEEERGL